MSLRELGLEIIGEVVARNTKNEKEKNNLFHMWSSLYKGITQGNEDRELKFYILAEEHLNKGIGSVFVKLKQEVVKDRKLDIKDILEQIHIAENYNDIETLASIIGEVFLEDIDSTTFKWFKAKMERQGWNWEALLSIYVNKQDYRVNRLLNIPYVRYIETRKIA